MDLQKELDSFIQEPAYGLPRAEKSARYAKMLSAATQYHREKCPEYGRFISALGCPAGSLFDAQKDAAEVSPLSISAADTSQLSMPAVDTSPLSMSAADAEASSGEMAAVAVKEEDIPFLPVSIFKEIDLRSIPEEEVFKTITSSGTSGQRPSRIFLDGRTSSLQQQVLARIVAQELGDRRLPCIMLDTKSVLRDRRQFSARGAGILGFSVFASRTCYALDENMQLNLEEVRDFIEVQRQKALDKGQEPKFMLYGFTFMIWQYFVRALEEAHIRLDLSGSVLIHGGGWKKLQAQAVSPEEFAARIRAVTGIETVRSYYGMAEQTGCICMECACGHLHASTWSDVIIRREKDYGVCEIGEPGVIQVLTPIAMSYPGHSLLTEDRGILLGEDDCPCGRKGKYFKVLGRLPKAEIRGCSDTFEGK